MAKERYIYVVETETRCSAVADRYDHGHDTFASFLAALEYDAEIEGKPEYRFAPRVVGYRRETIRLSA